VGTWLLLAGTLLVSACGANTLPATPTPALPVLSPPATASTVANSLPGSNAQADPAEAVDAAVQAAATHLGVGRDQLSVERVEAHQWPDSSLGCPQPGQLYSQIVTPGYLIVIAAGNKRLEYHTDNRAGVTLCKES
jgi:hypothetical protein